MSDKETLTIDIEKIIKEKLPKLAKKLPRFVFNYLKKILHQDDINGLLVRADGVSGLPFVTETMKEFNTGVVAEGLEHIEKDGRYIIAANHPIGGLDGIALIDTVGKIRPDVITPVNDFLLFVPNLRPLFIPVNKLGSNADNIKILNNTFAGDRTICYYPFGLCSRKQKGKIIDLEWKKTFITKAKTYHRDIIPTHISGRNSNFFYNLSNIRKFFGIKVNIEMLFLVNEFYTPGCSVYRIDAAIYNTEHLQGELFGKNGHLLKTIEYTRTVPTVGEDGSVTQIDVSEVTVTIKLVKVTLAEVEKLAGGDGSGRIQR